MTKTYALTYNIIPQLRIPVPTYVQSCLPDSYLQLIVQQYKHLHRQINKAQLHYAVVKHEVIHKHNFGAHLVSN